MRKTTALALRPATARLLPMRPLEATATASIHALITQIGTGALSLRHAERLRRATTALTGIVEDIEQVASHGENIARSSAQLARDIEHLASEVDEFQTKRAENEARRAEAAERKKHVGAAVREELCVRTLAATLEREELQDQLDARRTARAREKQRVDQERALSARRVDRGRATREARAEAARQKNAGDAARIVRDVQIGAVHADAAHPYHAYAGCVYLSAKLEEALSSTDAAERAREAVLTMMLGATLAADEIAAYHAAYLDLKARAAAVAKHRDTTEIFDAVEALTGEVQ